MVHRKTFEIETVGSRKTSDLRPKISDALPEGFNYRVHSYDETNKTCIVEIWCSESEILPIQHRKNASDLVQLDKLPGVVKEVPSPRAGDMIGSISVSDLVENVGKSGHSIENINRETKRITVKGIQIAFLRSVKSKDTKGREIEEFILDEG